VSVKRLRQLGVVGEINYQPFDAGGRIVDRPELRVLMQPDPLGRGQPTPDASRRPTATSWRSPGAGEARRRCAAPSRGDS